jgi:AraC family transcriptional regulator of arabinose operon
MPADLVGRLQRLPWPLPLSSAMNTMMRDALTLRQATLSTADAMQRALGMQMLWRYLGEGERLLAGGTGAHPAIERAQYFIQSHLNEPIALEDIAEAAAVSPAHLIRLFRDETATTPMAWVWQQRVRRGVELLESTGLPVGLIAQQCGFQTSHHFSRRVRGTTGLAPSAIRQRAWGR